MSDLSDYIRLVSDPLEKELIDDKEQAERERDEALGIVNSVWMTAKARIDAGKPDSAHLEIEQLCRSFLRSAGRIK